MTTQLNLITARAAGISKCRVKCEKCGREQGVDGAKALALGWPECHGYTMTLMRSNKKTKPQTTNS